MADEHTNRRAAIADDESPRLHGDALLEDVRRTLDPLAGGGR